MAQNFILYKHLLILAGKLYLIATPIGNLEDITLRALRTLKEVDIILCEDTRRTLKLLNHYNIKPKKMISYFEGNEEKRIPFIIKLLQSGKKIALVSDAGTPLISDPGYKLVRECIKNNIEVDSIPGPTALINALVLSGLPTNSFVFEGFLPRKKQKLLEKLQNIKEKDKKRTIIIYESVHRIDKTLDFIKEVFGDIEIVVVKEMTKINQKIFRGKISEIKKEIKERKKGEFVILWNIA